MFRRVQQHLIDERLQGFRAAVVEKRSRDPGQQFRAALALQPFGVKRRPAGRVVCANELERSLALLGVAERAEQGRSAGPGEDLDARRLDLTGGRAQPSGEHERFPGEGRIGACLPSAAKHLAGHERAHVTAPAPVPARQFDLLGQRGRRELGADLLLGAALGRQPVLHSRSAAGGQDPGVLLGAVPPARPVAVVEKTGKRGLDLGHAHRRAEALDDRRQSALRVGRDLGRESVPLFEPAPEEMARRQGRQVFLRRIDRHRDAPLLLEVQPQHPELGVGFDDPSRAAPRHREHAADVVFEPGFEDFQRLERLARPGQREVFQQRLQRRPAGPQMAHAIPKARAQLLSVPDSEPDYLAEEQFQARPRALGARLVRRQLQQRRGQGSLPRRPEPPERLGKRLAVSDPHLQPGEPELLDLPGVAAGDQGVPLHQPGRVTHGR